MLRNTYAYMYTQSNLFRVIKYNGNKSKSLITKQYRHIKRFINKKDKKSDSSKNWCDKTVISIVYNIIADWPMSTLTIFDATIL